MDYSKYYLEEFKKYISLRSSSPNTIKNYLSDLRVFFGFVNEQMSLPVSNDTLPKLLSEATLVRYDEFLSSTNPPATAKRRNSSLKKFIEFCAGQNIISPPSPTPPPPAATSADTPLSSFSTPITTPAPVTYPSRPAESPAPSAPASTPTPAAQSPVPSWVPVHPIPEPSGQPTPAPVPPPSETRPSPTSAPDHSTSSGPVPWSVVLSSQKAESSGISENSGSTQQSKPVAESKPFPDQESEVTSPSLVNYFADLPGSDTQPVHREETVRPYSEKTVSLYLVLSLTLIAFLASFAITYLIATTFLVR